MANAMNGTNWEVVRPIWDANTGVIIGFAGDTASGVQIPEHRNDGGEMAGTATFGGRISKGIYWNPAGQAFELPPMAGVDPLYGSSHIMAHGINNLGQIVGMSKESAPNFFVHAVLWLSKDVAPLDLGFLGAGDFGINYSEAYGVNDFRHVVGVGTVSSATRAFLWRDGRMIDLGALSGQVVAEAHAVSNSGVIAGKSNFYPVVWRYDPSNPSSTPVIQQLPIPSGFFSATPTAVNDSADVAGYAGSPSIDAHAILWRNGKAIDLGVWPGGHYSAAYGINNLGQIAGTGTVAADNLDHALVWTVAAPGGVGGNTAPSASLQATSSTSIRAGGSVSVRASFTDPDNGPWSYSLNWGDGSTTTGNSSNAGTISGISAHVYSASGTFKAKLTVTDSRGATGGSNTITVKVR